MQPARSACVTAQRGCVEAQEPTFAIMAARRTAWRPHKTAAVGLRASVRVGLARLARLLQIGKEGPRFFTCDAFHKRVTFGLDALLYPRIGRAAEALDMRHRRCRKTCDPTRHLICGTSHLSIRDDLIDQAKAFGIGRLDDLAQKEYLVCFHTSDPHRQQPARTDFRNEPQLREWRGKFDRAVGKNDVAVE